MKEKEKKEEKKEVKKMDLEAIATEITAVLLVSGKMIKETSWSLTTKGWSHKS